MILEWQTEITCNEKTWWCAYDNFVVSSGGNVEYLVVVGDGGAGGHYQGGGGGAYSGTGQNGGKVTLAL